MPSECVMSSDQSLPAATPMSGLDRIKGYPFLGVVPMVRKDPLRFYGELSRDRGDIVQLRFGPEWLYFLNRRDHVKHVFQDNRDNYIKSKHYSRMKFLLGDGMFTTNGETWAGQRRSAQPAFNGDHLKKMFGIMRAATDDMLGRWDQNVAENREIGLSSEAMRLALDVALRTLFGITLNDQARVIYDALNVILPELERRVWAVTPLANYLPLRKIRACKEAIAAIERVVHEIIFERLNAEHQADDLMSMLIAAEKARWDDQSLKRLRDQAVIFLIAGHETTATTLTWAWYCLSKFPLIDRRLSAEVQSVLGARPVELGDLDTLAYTRAVFQETMRLFPPGWLLTREALADDTIGGRLIPKGSTVIICAYSMHRMPEYWDNPEGFDPSRFMPERMKEIDSSVYFPFGGGNRTCIGNRFAMMEAQIILAETVRKFRLELVTGQDIIPSAMITIRPKHEIRMRLRRRENVPGEQSGLQQVA